MFMFLMHSSVLSPLRASHRRRSILFKCAIPKVTKRTRVRLNHASTEQPWNITVPEEMDDVLERRLVSFCSCMDEGSDSESTAAPPDAGQMNRASFNLCTEPPVFLAKRKEKAFRRQ
jgi:hypothetical protein